MPTSVTSDGEETSALLRRLPGVRALQLELAEGRMLTPSMRRLRLSGEGLDTLEARPGQDLMVAVPADGRQHFRRRYTIRHLDGEQRWVDLDIVLHGEGPGARWARGARPGDRVEAVGPRGKIFLADGADRHLFFGDESALPAVFAMIEGLPQDASAVATLEVAGPENEQQPDHPRCAATLRYLHRSGEPGTASALGDAAAEVELPAGPCHAYVFGELRQVAAVRAALIERGMRPGDIDHKPYWRLGVSNAPHGEPERGE